MYKMYGGVGGVQSVWVDWVCTLCIGEVGLYMVCGLSQLVYRMY